MTGAPVVAATSGSDRATHADLPRPVHAATIRRARTTGQNCVAGGATIEPKAAPFASDDQGQSPKTMSTGPGVQ
jgi:hypothetical protein